MASRDWGTDRRGSRACHRLRSLAVLRRGATRDVTAYPLFRGGDWSSPVGWCTTAR